MEITINTYVTEVTFLHKGKFVTKRFECNRSGYPFDRIVFDPCDSYCKPPIISKSLPILVDSEELLIYTDQIVARSENRAKNTLEVITTAVRWHFEYVTKVCANSYEADFMTYV